MADNLIKRLYNAAVNKSHTYSLTGGKQTFFRLIGSYLSGVFLGKYDYNKFTEAYGENPLVYMIIKKISFTSASINRKAYDSNGEEFENQEDSEVLQLIKNPNSEQDEIEFREQCNEYLSTTGNTFIRYMSGVGGVGKEIRTLITNNVEIVCSKSGDIIRYDYTKPGGGTVKINPEDVLHVKESNIVNFQDYQELKFGLSRLQAAWIVVRSSMEKFEAEAAIFQNRGIVGVLSNGSDQPLLKPEKEALNNAFKEATGGPENYNGVHVTNSNVKYVQLGMSPTDLKLLDGIVSSLRILCGVYGISSILFNDNEKSTFNNYQQVEKTAYMDVYVPLANKFDKALSTFLSEKLGVNESVKVDLTSVEVLKSTTNELANSLNNLDPKLLERLMENMTQEEIRSVVPFLPQLSENDEVIGSMRSTNNNSDD